MIKQDKKVYKIIGSDMFVAENMQETFKQILSEDMQSTALNIPSTTLLIYGSEDEATPVRYGKLFSKSIAGSKLEIIEGADHFLHHSHTAQVNMLISSFLEQK
jgi:pimeloyl-ACP methyl ester carboxylesterase